MAEQAAIGLRQQAVVWRDQLRADLRRPRSRRAALRLTAWLLFAVSLVVPVVRTTMGFHEVVFPIVLIAGLASLLWVSPRNDVRTWIFYVISLYFFVHLRDAADETAIAASTDYVLDWETSWFSTTTPSAWLQERLGGADGETNLISFVTTFVHWSWFLFPHAIVFGAYFFARPLFFRIAAVMMGTFFFAVALYYLVPTVPPWLAAEDGATTGIRRVITDVGPQIFGQAIFDDLFDLLAEPNPRAAMPSLHFAAASIVVFLSYLLRAPRLFAAALVYAGAMAFSLIYLGEHYFADVFVGGIVAVVAAFIVETALGNGPGKRYAWPAVSWARRRLRSHAAPILAPRQGTRGTSGGR